MLTLVRNGVAALCAVLSICGCSGDDAPSNTTDSGPTGNDARASAPSKGGTGGEVPTTPGDGGSVDHASGRGGAGDICSRPNVCTADYPCEKFGDSYTCRGQFADWTPTDSPSTFMVNDDGTVTDSRSGLVWQRAVDDTGYAWRDAQAHCVALSLAGGGWRLPTRAELESIVDFGRPSPAIDVTAFPDTPPLFFWSSSLRQMESWWFIDFANGTTQSGLPDDPYNVRCVREGESK